VLHGYGCPRLQLSETKIGNSSCNALSDLHEDITWQLKDALGLCDFGSDRICELPLLLWLLSTSYDLGNQLSFHAELIQGIILILLLLELHLVAIRK
jgi:hypothetical protein